MKTFERDGIVFRQILTKPSDRGISTDNEFVIVKSDLMLAYYNRLQATPPRTIMEIGMFEGGSLVWFDKLFRPERVVGIDIRREPIEALETYTRTAPQVRTYYGYNQEKLETLTVAQENFPDGMDLVVDDASHHYPQTRATFAMLFPLVRPGGRYVIEDWAWAHRPGAQNEGSVWFQRPALTNLIFELTVLAAASDVVETIEINTGMFVVTKGPGRFDASMLDVGPHLRGRALPQL